ncbi:hypothetical protein GGI07_003927 [Coemansia sp. Benny D115]|nr:hypothetical protein GGI07_003927 [Coemansia sp. Benny D115]
MAEYKIYTVDAFADAPFKGNQAAIVPVPVGKPLTDEVMLKLAAEMNISETAYIMPLDSGDNSVDENEVFASQSRFGLRWFTPTVEALLCGHATLAAAHVLFFELGNTSPELVFDTLSGALVVRRQENGYLQMTFPMDRPLPVVPVTQDIQCVVKGVLGKDYREDMEVSISPRLRYMVVYDPELTAKDVVELRPNITSEVYAAGERENVSLVIVTARGGNGRDFDSRCFGPWCGIDEDPVTGSAHTVLAPFWNKKLDKTLFSAFQCSQRGGDLSVEIVGDSLVAVGGRAVVIIRGYLTL